MRFSHDLVAEAARDSLPAALVAPLHRLVAEAVQAANRRAVELGDESGSGAR